MHVPVCGHINALFDKDLREERINRTLSLSRSEHSPEVLGTEPLQTIDHPIVQWHQYPDLLTEISIQKWPFSRRAHGVQDMHSTI